MRLPQRLIARSWRRSVHSSVSIVRWSYPPDIARPSVMLEKDLLELLVLFGSNNVEYLVVGGHAVAFHGHPRYTDDLDLFVRPDVVNGARIVQALRQFGFGALDITPDDFAADDRVIQLGRAPNRVDLLTRLSGVDFSEAWATKVAATLDGVPVWMISTESLIRNKRATARAQDLADAEFLERLRDR
jgi:hypothetical protein